MPQIAIGAERVFMMELLFQVAKYLADGKT